MRALGLAGDSSGQELQQAALALPRHRRIRVLPPVPIFREADHELSPRTKAWRGGHAQRGAQTGEIYRWCARWERDAVGRSAVHCALRGDGGWGGVTSRVRRSSALFSVLQLVVTELQDHVTEAEDGNPLSNDGVSDVEVGVVGSENPCCFWVC